MESERNIRDGFKVTIVGIFINVILIFLKLFLGFLGKSKALMADGLHSLSDLVTDIFVIIGLKFSSIPKDESHDYGHGKIETFIVMVIGAILFSAGIIILFSSIKSIVLIFKGVDLKQPDPATFLIALLSIVLKEWLYRYTMVVAEKFKNQSLKANAWHHRSDAFSSIAVTFGILFSIVNKKLVIMESFAAIVVVFFILKVSINILKASFEELTEKSLKEEEEKEIIEIIGSVEGVKNPHEIQTRRIGQYIAVDIHIEVDKDISVENSHRITEKIEEKLLERFKNKIYINIHVEPFLEGEG